MSTPATSVLFGFDFQTNAAIVLMLENIRELSSVRIEGIEDIEIQLSDGSYVLAQAKSVVDSGDFRNVSANEGYFHTVFHVITFVIGLNPLSETETANGRIDVSFETPSKIYLIEFKYSGNNTDKSEQALKQIKDKKYDLSYHTTGKVIEGIRISYSAKKRNINGIKNEVLYSPS